MRLRTIRVTRYVTPLREGGSLPAIVEADDDGLYVLKFRGAGQGPHALVAELLAGEVARALGLPVPEIVLRELDPDLARTEPDPEIQALIRASAGCNLALDYLPGATMFDPAGRPPRCRNSPRPSSGSTRCLQRRPHRAQSEPADVASAAVAHRPRRRAVLPPCRRRLRLACAAILSRASPTTCCCRWRGELAQVGRDARAAAHAAGAARDRRGAAGRLARRHWAWRRGCRR